MLLITAVWIVFFQVYPSPSSEGLTTKGYRAHVFKVMLVHTLEPTGAREYTFTTMERLLEGPPPPGYTFLLPEDEVTLPGGDLHEARVIERRAHEQVIEYRFVNTRSSTGRYRAYEDRVEPLWLEVFDFSAGAFYLIPLTAGAMCIAGIINLAWRRRASSRQFQ